MASPNFYETGISDEKGRRRTLISVLNRHILFDKTMGDNLKNLNHFPGGADSTTDNWEIMSPFKISAKAGIQSLVKNIWMPDHVRHDGKNRWSQLNSPTSD